MCRQVGDRLEVPLGGGVGGDGDGVGVRRRRRRQNRQVARQPFVQLQFDGVEHGHCRLRLEVQQQVADVLGHQVDRMVFQRRDIRLAAADTHPSSDVETVGLQRLCIDFGDDFRFRKAGGSDHDRVHIARRPAERIRAAAGRDNEAQAREPRRRAVPAPSQHAHSNRHYLAAPASAWGCGRGFRRDFVSFRRDKGQDGNHEQRFVCIARSAT